MFVDNQVLPLVPPQDPFYLMVRGRLSFCCNLKDIMIVVRPNVIEQELGTRKGHAGFLVKLPYHRFVRRFAGLDPSSREEIEIDAFIQGY